MRIKTTPDSNLQATEICFLISEQSQIHRAPTRIHSSSSRFHQQPARSAPRNCGGSTRSDRNQPRTRAREGKTSTWPPTTAMAGSESQSVGRALSSPWSPRAVQARCSLLTREIRFSMAAAPGWRDLAGWREAEGEIETRRREARGRGGEADRPAASRRRSLGSS